MCGIWGIVCKEKKISANNIKNVIKDLMILSETRGKDACGISIFTDEKMTVMKRVKPASQMVKDKDFKDYLDDNIIEGDAHLIMGHSRLVTNGTQYITNNNQPVMKHNIAMVHNGIVVNENNLWANNSELVRKYEVDTEIIVELLNKYIISENVENAMERVYTQIEGMASTIGIIPVHKTLVAASNNGSLYYYSNADNSIVIIASERLFVKQVVNKYRKLFGEEKAGCIKQLKNSKPALWRLNNKSNDKEYNLSVNCDKEVVKIRSAINTVTREVKGKFDINFEKIRKIRRCTKCVLPETMPFIEFDDKGVCNYCNTYKKQEYKGEKALQDWTKKIKSEGKRNNCMVSFSGGRDSSYGLHYFVKELGLKPITYCYDWGMVSDLARRNQSRMCSQLGVEFIVVSADIQKKRDNIKKNILAWIKNPDLGMIPLFMAGDKQYFYYANKICKDYNIGNILLASNPFEKTFFKSGFCGIKPDILNEYENGLDVERLPYKDVLKMAAYYTSQYSKNLSYINSSLIDTFTAAMSYFIIPHNYFRLFDYIAWNEDQVNKVLINEYGWEMAEDTKSTWRIGDGTASFYNYIYCMVGGFTENDTLRSNQIREGMLSRDDALQLVYRDNEPRFESMKWYFDVLGLDMWEVLKVVCNIPKLYD